MKTHIGFRASSTFQAAVGAVGELSAAARGLIIVGLATSGHDVSALNDEIRAALAGVTDRELQARLSGLLFNNRVTDVKHQRPALALVVREEVPTSAEPDLWSIGMEV